MREFYPPQQRGSNYPTNDRSAKRMALWLYGVGGGVALIIVLFFCLFLQPLGMVLGFFLTIAAFFVIGMLAARKTGRVSTGSLASLIAGSIVAVVTLAVYTVIFLNPEFWQLLIQQSRTLPQLATMSPAELDSLIKTALIMWAIVILVFMIGGGAGLGALGGLFGKNRSNNGSSPYSSQYPQYPHYPPQPDYGSSNQYGHASTPSYSHLATTSESAASYTPRSVFGSEVVQPEHEVNPYANMHEPVAPEEYMSPDYYNPSLSARPKEQE